MENSNPKEPLFQDLPPEYQEFKEDSNGKMIFENLFKPVEITR
jgi:hypothetical protein